MKHELLGFSLIPFKGCTLLNNINITNTELGSIEKILALF